MAVVCSGRRAVGQAMLIAGLGGLIAHEMLRAPAACAMTDCSVTFVDRTDEAGLTGAVHETGAGFNIGFVNVSSFVGGGIVGDFNNDGFQDIFFLGGGGVRDRLYLNNGDGTFRERAIPWGIGEKHLGVGASAADTNNNGWIDIYVTSFGTTTADVGKHRLYRNTGANSFVNAAEEANLQFTSTNLPDGFGSAWGDINLNGELDMYVGGWVTPANSNRLFRNQGDGTMSDITIGSGVDNQFIRVFAPRFADMDGDGYPELLVAADFGTSRYFVNNHDETFTNMTAASGTGLDDNGMGQTVGDFTGDGRLDWYVTSIYTEHGFPHIPGTGNMLYLNQGDHLYIEKSVEAGVNDGAWGWGTAAADFNHNGRVDIVATNGYPQANSQGEQEWLNVPSHLFLNQGDGSFIETAMECGLVHTGMGRGLLVFDYENNGRMDVLIFTRDDQMRLYRNETENDGTRNWLRIALDTSANPRLAPNGYGTRVTARTGETVQVRAITGGDNYLSQSELTAHFGLGTARTIDELRIYWNDGTVSAYENVPANQQLTIEAEVLCDLTGSGVVDSSDLVHLLGAWGEFSGPADLNADGVVDVQDLQILLANWGVQAVESPERSEQAPRRR